MKNRFPFKKFHLWLRHRTAEYCLRAFIFLVPRIPHRLRVPITSAVARLTLAILWRYRKLMEQNVSMAMSDQFLPVERKKTVVRRAWRNFVGDFMRLPAPYIPPGTRYVPALLLRARSI